MLLLYTRLFKISSATPSPETLPSINQPNQNVAQSTEPEIEPGVDSIRPNSSSLNVHLHLRQVQATYYLERRLFS